MKGTVETTALDFSQAELQALGALRHRYGISCDRFSDREQARLLFLRWLFRTGRALSLAGRGLDGPSPEEVAT